MKHFYLLLFVTLSLLLAACDLDFTTPDQIPTNLQATTPKNYTVDLNWTIALSPQVPEPRMWLERKVADGEFERLADVTGKTSFEDFPVFDDITYTYRLKAGNQNSEVTVTVPVVTPNPLTVTLTADAQSIKQTIGKSGGSISVTGSNGVVYALTIPADALLADTAITLTPVSQIGNLPLSGGLLGAVKIEPEDLEFYNYATLSMTSTPAVASEMKAVGFSSSNTGQEFYLYPFSTKTPSSVLQAQQDDDELAPIRPIKGGTYGAGSGTVQDVKEQVQENPPTDSSSQTQQQGAVDDELAPIQTPTQHAGKWATTLMLKELNRPSSQTLQVFREFRQWLEYLRRHNLEKDFDSNIKAHSQRQATRISKRFDELYQQCEAGDRKVRKEMKELLHWSKLYPAIVQNLGAGWFSEAQDRVEMCGIPNWKGFAAIHASQGILKGYSGAADLIWVVETVTDDVVTYSATIGDRTFEISSANNCTAAVNSIEPQLEGSFLTVDYSTTPASYSGMFFLNVNYTVTCQDESQTLTAPFPIMYPTLNATLSNNDKEIRGHIEVDYASDWIFDPVPRSNP